MLCCLSSVPHGNVGPPDRHGESNCQSLTHIVGVSSEDLVEYSAVQVLFIHDIHDSKSDTQPSYCRIRNLNY